MSESLPKNRDDLSVTVPGFKNLAPLVMDMGALKEGERRIVEAKLVNPSTYVELEHVFNQSYMELKRNISAIGFQIGRMEKEIERAKATLLFDKYPEFIKDKPKNLDTAATRNLFLANDPEIQEGEDSLLFLKRLESNLDGRIRVMENVCRYMRRQMDIVLRQMPSGNIYNR